MEDPKREDGSVVEKDPNRIPTLEEKTQLSYEIFKIGKTVIVK